MLDFSRAWHPKLECCQTKSETCSAAILQVGVCAYWLFRVLFRHIVLRKYGFGGCVDWSDLQASLFRASQQ
jgi:hypothetical protein